jgi:hypothetical protein
MNKNVYFENRYMSGRKINWLRRCHDGILRFRASDNLLIYVCHVGFILHFRRYYDGRYSHCG